MSTVCSATLQPSPSLLAVETTLPDKSTASAAPTRSSQKKQFKRSVSFTEVEVREYARALGDNPATSSGPSLTIGWEYGSMKSLPLEEYENSRPSPSRRSVSQLQVPGTVREAMLRHHTECTKEDIAKAVHQVRQARHERQMTVALQEFESWHLALESFQRKWSRFTKRKPSKQREMELLWEQAADERKKLVRKGAGEMNDEVGTSSSSWSSTGACGIIGSPSSASQYGEEVVYGKEESSTDNDEEELEHIMLDASGRRGNKSKTTATRDKGFVVVGEDGTTIVQSTTKDSPSTARAHQAPDSAGQVIVIQNKASRRTKGLFGRSKSEVNSRETGDNSSRSGNGRSRSTTEKAVGAIMEC